MPSEIPSPVLHALQEIHREIAGVNEGRLADYIPELSKADPNWFGICVVTASGAVYEVGDTAQRFTIQSISKPFVYGLALEDRGFAEVSAKVGVEPTGEAFNSISLEPGTGRPRNPMINAGAIATTGLVQGAHLNHRRERILANLSHFAGRALTIDEAVHRSESETGHRNRAIGHMLRNFGILSENPEPIVDLYFQQCSVEVTCRDLAVMAATLANHGVNPLTGEHAMQGAYIEHVLSVMGTCGMYNWAGEWLYRVGIPAKSGVSGGVLAVLPGQIGIGVFSPPLDERGNSVRGIRVCDALSRQFDLHLFNTRSPGPALRARFTAAEIGSRRVRTDLEKRILASHGQRILVLQLQGLLGFATIEPVIRDALESAGAVTHLVLDLQRVQSIGESASRLLHDLLVQLAERGIVLAFPHGREHRALVRVIEAKLGSRRSEFHTFPDLDSALEWCEERVLYDQARANTTPLFVERGSNELLTGLATEDATALKAVLVRREFPAGAEIVRVGEPARHLYLIESGRVSARIVTGDGPDQRLASFCPGMVFGELALLEDTTRSASVFADTDAVCFELSIETFQRVATEHPTLQVGILRNIGLSLADKLRRTNKALAAIQ